MFGRKKKADETSPSMILPPGFSQDDTEISMPGFSQEPQYQQPQHQQQYTQPVQQYTQPTQQPVQQQPAQQKPVFQPQAQIFRAEITDKGTYVYFVETNYPLAIGECQLVQ